MPIRLALIGTGRWGTKIETTLASLPGVSLAYTATHDWKPLLEKADIDGVLIATPPSSHTEIALAFIARGTPVFIEKPMTLSVADADTIVSASEQNTVPIMVGHEHLYNPAFEAMKAALPDIGTITRIEGCEAHDGPVRPDYSTMWDSMPHDLSMMIDVLGMPLAVQAYGEAKTKPGTTLYDTARMELTFPNHVEGIITSDWLSKEKVRTLTIVGQHGRLVLDDTRPADKVTMILGTNTRALPYASAWPLTRELEAFVALIQQGTKPRATAREGRATIAVLEAADQSIAQGGASITL